MAMMASCWWLGLVFFNENCTSVKRVNKFVKAQCGQTIGDIASVNIPDEFSSYSVGSLQSTTKFEESCQHKYVRCEPDMPVNVIVDAGMKYIHVNMTPPTVHPQVQSSEGSSITSAFDVLMQMRRKYTHLPKARDINTEKDRLYNDIISCLEKENVMFMSHQMDLGKSIVKDLCDVLWYVDPFHERLKSRHITIPKPFDRFTGYRNWKQQHKREPQITHEELHIQMEKLSRILMSPWILNDKFATFRSKLSGFMEGLQKYDTFLTQQQSRSQLNHQKLDTVRNWSDSFSFSSKPANEKICSENQGKKSKFVYNYTTIIKALESSDYYEPLDLSELEPSDPVKRRLWLEHLQLPFPYGIFTYSHGNYLGNLTVVWKQPPDMQDCDTSEDIRVINEIKSNMNKYATRAMRREFMDLYAKSTKDKPAILRSMFSFLTGYSMSPENEKEAEVDKRVCEFLLNSDDPSLIFDLRKNNGRLKDPKFDPFWEELQKFLDERSVVYERRHTDVAYMPFAISVPDLRDQILKRLPPNSVAPSESWIRLNFCPSNVYVNSAARYTGRFHVRHAVQQRLLRAQHIDSEYAYFQYTLLKHFAVKWKSNTSMQCLDDKAIIPVGEPGKPTGACCRSHNPGLVSGSNPQLLSLDHDYNICGIVPSALLEVDIPSDVKDTFHRGDVHITLKDKVFQSSSPLRHSTETIKIVRETNSSDGVHSDCPIIVRYTDGGPDHRTTYTSVQFAAILEFIALDLDMFIACRTAPNQSYNNPAERVMSLLNLGLQNVSLSRAEMDAGNELLMRSMTSLKKIRNCGKPSLQEALKASVAVPVGIVKDIFTRLRRKHGEVFVHDACGEEEMKDLLSMTRIVCWEDLDPKLKTFSSNEKLSDFVKRHCRSRHYVFQIKKCDQNKVDDCPYCCLSPPRIPAEHYTDLHFLPDPVLDQDGNYKRFEEVYGHDTTENDRPSLKVKPEATSRDKSFRSVLVAGILLFSSEVRGFVMCVECGKRRVVYSSAKFTRAQQEFLLRTQEELMYVCGNKLVPSGPMEDVIIVREGLNCLSPIEASYYAGITQVFDEICFHCGDTETVRNDEIMELREKFSIVRPICSTCMNLKNLKPVTRNARKIKKPKQK